ncbi:uncharacterized protein LOC132698078 [Cylas formicarius]|uniref:uncharacterized protein LOC132698078 n=1 Tax=Cylas formicarius TaxID=197179 RepID=UPI0029588406|nr:uncharacterized protein LOC132698078 [Cylas formicarius]
MYATKLDKTPEEKESAKQELMAAETDREAFEREFKNFGVTKRIKEASPSPAGGAPRGDAAADRNTVESARERHLAATGRHRRCIISSALNMPREVGYTLEGSENIQCLSYADDLVVLSSTRFGMNVALKHLQSTAVRQLGASSWLPPPLTSPPAITPPTTTPCLRCSVAPPERTAPLIYRACVVRPSVQPSRRGRFEIVFCPTARGFEISVQSVFLASTRRLPCERCGRGYLTAASLAQHRRRYCRGAVGEGPSGCEECGRALATYAGARQHMRRAHPDACRRSVELGDRRRADPISEVERSAICLAELEYGGTTVNKHLAEKFHRTVDAIKNLRKQRTYCSLRAQQWKLNNRRLRTIQLTPLLDSTGPHRPSSSTGDQSASPPSRRAAPSSSPPLECGDSVFRAGPSSSSLPSTSSAPSSASSSPGAPAAAPSASQTGAFAAGAAPGGTEVIREYLSELAAQAGVSHAIRELVGRIVGGVGDAVAGGDLSGAMVDCRGPPCRCPRQELYSKDRSALADLIVRGVDPAAMGVVPSDGEIRAHYEAVFAGAAPEDRQIISDYKTLVRGLYSPVLLRSVETAIRCPRASSAAGPDGMSGADLTRLDVRSVAIYNAMLLTRRTPSILKGCRSTLIPKGGGDPADVGSWRPITVSNILIRTFHRILAARLGALEIHSTQRGFRGLDGAMANAIILQAAIKGCRASSRPYCVSALDLRKAFDTVPHASIVRAHRFGVEQPFIDYLMTACPVLDELMVWLSSMPTGVGIGDVRVNAMAYADDLLLLTQSTREMQVVLRECQRFFEARSMELNASKCFNITVAPALKKLYLATQDPLFIGAKVVPVVGADSVFKYLGHKVGFMGTDPPSLDCLGDAMGRLLRVPLKPYKRLRLL